MALVGRCPAPYELRWVAVRTAKHRDREWDGLGTVVYLPLLATVRYPSLR